VITAFQMTHQKRRACVIHAVLFTAKCLTYGSDLSIVCVLYNKKEKYKTIF